MEEELENLQIQLMSNINDAELIMMNAKDIISYMNLDPEFHQDLELADSALKELLYRISQAVDPKALEQFLLATKQIKIMASDLIDACKQNMYSA